MNKAELIDAIAADTKLTKKDVDAVVKASTENVAKSLEKGDSVQLIGFGTFDVGERAAREGINPATKETIKIPAKVAATFKAGSKLKDALN